MEQEIVNQNTSGTSQPMVKPDNHMVFAIITTLIFFLPFGVVALYKGSQVDNLYAAGNYQEAVAASNDAKKWCIWGLIVWAVCFGLLVLLFILYMVFIFSLIP